MRRILNLSEGFVGMLSNKSVTKKSECVINSEYSLKELTKGDTSVSKIIKHLSGYGKSRFNM